MSEIKNSGLDRYGAEPFEQQQFGTAGVEGVKEHIVPRSLWQPHSMVHSHPALLIRIV